ncbi:HAUS augmin-like complex subunit 6 isoform X1 [Anolis sagrei]|uniref:HAUS augmin-like complex subunit 6 isoform X1 n=1 Tax=Anolis sagrei TaxID=38937 RepID=UPI003521B8DF
MTAKAPRPDWEKEYLWHSLLALGFDPEGAAAAAGKISTHLRLGENMFDQPNKDAFHVVAWFLFSKLDQSRCNEIFRLCFPPTDKKEDAECRKQAYEWLKKISDDCGEGFPQVVPSLFLSPGGPKFIHLMFHFSRYVIMHYIKVNSTAGGISYPKALNSKSPDLSMAMAKFQVCQNRFLMALQKEDSLIQELQKKAQLLTKQIRNLQHENADLDRQLQKMKENVPQNQLNTLQRIEKVRSSWEAVMKVLHLLRNEREVVDAVLKGHVDEYILDGTSVNINIPRPLIEKIEKEIHTFPMGNVYEGGKLNSLTVIQLLNRALKMLINERRHSEKDPLKLDLKYFEGKTKSQNKALQGLKSLRLKLKHEDRKLISQMITEKQQEWDLKWKTCLGQSPFRLMREPNPALDFLPAMSPLSFAPATEEAYKNSVFCQFPASVPEVIEKNLQTDQFEGTGKARECQGYSTVLTAERDVMSSNLARASEDRMAFERESNADTPTRAEPSDFQILKYTGRKSKLAEIGKKRQIRVPKTPSTVKREDLLKRAQEQLAEEVANVIVSESPQNIGGKGKDLEDLIGSLTSDPFLTRKQIPRTPENLISEIRSSWKKAIQVEESSKAESHHADTTKKDLLQDAVLASGTPVDSSMAVFMSSGSVESPPFLEMPSSGNLKQGILGPNELSSHQRCAGPLDDSFFKQGLTPTVSDDPSTGNPTVSLKTVNKCANELCDDPGKSVYSQDSSLCTTLPWTGTRMSSGNYDDSQEVVHFGILQETLPEEAEFISPKSFKDLESDEVREDSSQDNNKAVPDHVAENEHKLDLHSIRKRYKALEKTLLKNSSSRKPISRRRSDFSLLSVGLETTDVLSPSGKPYAFDAELMKPPTQMALPERKVPASPLVPFSPLQAGKNVDACSEGDLFDKLKG